MKKMHGTFVKVVTVAGLLVLGTGSSWAAEYRATSEPGAHEVAVLTGEWVDHNRGDREVPWKIYYPKDAGTPVPVVIWSHGGGGSRDGAEYLGRFLASHGYAAVHIQHHGSDIDVLRRAGGREGLLSALQGNQEATVQRLKDVPFAVDQIEAMNRSGPLAGRLDTTTMGMSGHSFGAITTLAVAGQQVRGFGQRFAMPFVKGAFAMSPSPPRDGTPPEEAFGHLLMPVFHLTGTQDRSPLEDFEPRARQVPFDSNASVDQYLLVMENAVHMTFAGITSMGGRDVSYPGIERHHELIKIAALTFWDAYLKGDADALAWLQGGGYAREVGNAGTFRSKPAACALARAAAR